MDVLAFFLVGFITTTTNVLRISGPTTPVVKNSPVQVIHIALIGLMFAPLALSYLMGKAGARDIDASVSEWVWTLPITKSALYGARFLGAWMLASLAILMLPVGVELGAHMPWVDADKVGPIRWDAHLEALGVFILPGMWTVGAVLYALATHFRTHRAAIVGGVGFFFVYLLSFLINLNFLGKRTFLLIDPFGLAWVYYTTRYWSPIELNTRLVPIGWLGLGIRMAWVGLSTVFLLWAGMRFQPLLSAVKSQKEPVVPPPLSALTPILSPPTSLGFRRWLAHLRFGMEILGRSYTFWILLGFFILYTLFDFYTTFVVWDIGAIQRILPIPTTSGILQRMEFNFIGVLLLLLVLLVVFAGELLHRDREQRVAAWMALTSEPHAYTARAAALFIMLCLTLGVFVVIGMGL